MPGPCGSRGDRVDMSPNAEPFSRAAQDLTGSPTRAYSPDIIATYEERGVKIIFSQPSVPLFRGLGPRGGFFGPD